MSQSDFDTNELDELQLTDAGVFVPESMELPRARVTIEAVFALVAAFFIGLPTPFLAAIAVAHAGRDVPIAVSVAVFVLTGYLAITVVRVAARAVEGETPRSPSFALMSSSSPLECFDANAYLPLALAMSIRLPKWWMIVRPPIALWWLCHFVAAALLGHVTAKFINGVNNAMLLVAIPFSLVMTLGFLFAANLYLMLAFAVCFRDVRIWLICWRYRVVIDLILATVLSVVAV